MATERDEKILGLRETCDWIRREDEAIQRERFDEMITADEARSRFAPNYTVDHILNHVDSVCESHQSVTGYKDSRMPDDVVEELESRGFKCEIDKGTWTIRWDNWSDADVKSAVDDAKLHAIRDGE